MFRFTHKFNKIWNQLIIRSRSAGNHIINVRLVYMCPGDDVFIMMLPAHNRLFVLTLFSALYTGRHYQPYEAWNCNYCAHIHTHTGTNIHHNEICVHDRPIWCALCIWNYVHKRALVLSRDPSLKTLVLINCIRIHSGCN
jgi:hypothetical protein